MYYFGQDCVPEEPNPLSEPVLRLNSCLFVQHLQAQKV